MVSLVLFLCVGLCILGLALAEQLLATSTNDRRGHVVTRTRRDLYNSSIHGPGRLNSDEFHEIGIIARERYLHNQPFQHLVIDNAVDDSILENLKQEIHQLDTKLWKTTNKRTSRKKGLNLGASDPLVVGPNFVRLTNFVHSAGFRWFLSNLTGITDLLIDPYVWGAGVSRIDNGGFLSIHTDFNQHPKAGWRRLNLLLYLNTNWREGYGGSLELWRGSPGLTDFRYEAKILPTFNRMVLFATTDISFHGHMDVVNHPRGEKRLAFSTYYYTKEKNDPLIADKPHSTIYPKFFLHDTQKPSVNRWRKVQPLRVLL
eukprot:1183905-Prorocentrum_minimum.AAC.1